MGPWGGLRFTRFGHYRVYWILEVIRMVGVVEVIKVVGVVEVTRVVGVVKVVGVGEEAKCLRKQEKS